MSAAEPTLLQWYAVRSLYRVDVAGPAKQSADLSAFEERIVLVLAEDLDRALEEGQIEARGYAQESSWPNANGDLVVSRFLGACDAFSISSPPLHLSEVYSKILYLPASTSNDAMLNRVFGTEREQAPDDVSVFEPDFERVARAPNRADRRPDGET